MLFRQLFDKVSSTYTYLLAVDYGKKAVIIDPVKQNIDHYLRLIKEFELNLVAAIDTHLHADHITALGELRLLLGCELWMGEQSQAQGVSHRMRDNAVLDFEELQLTALYTPGHTDDSYCLLMGDRVFTGDTLFIRGTGRVDFQNGSSSQLYDSLMNRLFCLPKDTLVYPGHDYHGMTVSTIGEEIKFNPRMRVSSRESFESLMNGLNLPKPAMMDVAVPANKNCGILDG